MLTIGARRSLGHPHLNPISTALCCLFILTLTHSVCAELAFAKKKSEEVYSVRYSYERLSKMTTEGPQKRYVLMPQPLSIPLETFKTAKDRYRAHFDALKASKSSNYGKTGFNTSKSDENVVQIFLDQEKQVNHPFIMAEVIFTMIDAGAKHIEFPKSEYSGKPYTKADVNYSAYQLTLPYWEGLPPQSLSGGLLSFPDGTLVTAKALTELLNAKDDKLIKHMNTSLKSGELDPVTAIVKTSEALREQGKIIDPLSQGFIPLLNAASKAIRLLALRGLKGHDRLEVNQKLHEVMDEDPEADVQAQAAAMLSQSKDPKFSESAQFFALRSSSTEAIIAAAQGLAKAKTREATPRLLKALSHNSAEVRTALIEALVTRRAQAELAKTLTGELSLAVKIDVADVLSKEGGKKNFKLQAYEFLARQPNGEAAANAAQALTKETSFKASLSLLAELCAHPEPVARTAALNGLKTLGGEGGLKAVMKADFEDPQTGALAHDTLRAIYGDLKSNVALKAAQGKGAKAVKSAATGALGVLYQKDKKLRKKLFAVLKELTKDPEPLVRAAVARSLGDVKSEEAKAELVSLSQDSALEVKRLVAFAWRSYDEESARELLSANLELEDSALLVNSLDSLGLLNSVKSLSKVLDERFLKHKDVLIRRAAIGALAALAPQLEGKERAAVVSYTSPMIKDADPEVQLRVVKALGAAPNSESEFALAANFESGDTTLTLAIISALVQHQSVSALESLSAVIEINNAEVRRTMYSLGSQLKSAELKSALKSVLTKALKREQDAALKALLESELKSL